DRELAVAVDQPGPAAAEAFHRGVGELLLEAIVSAEVRFDPLGDAAAGLAAALGPQAVPEERVVPCLRGVIENLAVFLAACGLGDDALERHVRETRAGHQL